VAIYQLQRKRHGPKRQNEAAKATARIIFFMRRLVIVANLVLSATPAGNPVASLDVRHFAHPGLEVMSQLSESGLTSSRCRNRLRGSFTMPSLD
jgi:hypothetical protein